MLKRRGVILLSIIFAFISVVKAQDRSRFLYHFIHEAPLGIAFNDLPGFIWAHSDKNKNIYGPGNSFELQLIKKTNGNRPWEIKYKLPRISVSFLYTDFGKPNLTGKAYSIIPQFEFGIIRKQNAEFNFKLGTGLGYLTKIFDAQDNYKNITIGSPLNLSFQAMLVYHQRLYKNIELNAGLGLMHFSSGNIRLPNLGINYPSASVGLSYFLSNPYIRQIPVMDSMNQKFDTEKKWGYYFFGGWAYKEQGNERFRRFDVFTISSNFQYRISMRSTWLTGVDIFYDKSFFYLSTPDLQNYTSARLKDNLQVGITVGHELKAGRVSMITQLGAYTYYPYKAKKAIYQRIGLKTEIYKGFFIGSFLKTHFMQADFVEWIAGYQFYHK
jgi:hypothetical protein